MVSVRYAWHKHSDEIRFTPDGLDAINGIFIFFELVF